MAPGLVVAQSPGPGTMEVRGNEVHVLLSGRALPAHPGVPPGQRAHSRAARGWPRVDGRAWMAVRG
jgi:hypothetical protein